MNQLLSALEQIVIFLFIAQPMVIQVILYSIAKLIFRKIPQHQLYAVCLVINAILLILERQYYLSIEDIDQESMDELADFAFADLALITIWILWYIGVLIVGIVKFVKSRKNMTDENSNSNSNQDDSTSEPHP
ncbi:MAG TPA: hypothetical protein DCO72_03505 [Ruminococcus sp.]|nr:hypothetical protein [Ruminococcus sp.]